MTDTSKIAANPVVSYTKGWPTQRFVAVVNGARLVDKAGRDRLFDTKEAALRAAKKAMA